MKWDFKYSRKKMKNQNTTDPKRVLIEYVVNCETGRVTLDEIINNIGFEYAIPSNVIALSYQEVKILNIWIEGVGHEGGGVDTGEGGERAGAGKECEDAGEVPASGVVNFDWV